MHIYMCAYMHTITSNVWDSEEREGAKLQKKSHGSWFGSTLAQFFSLLGMPLSEIKVETLIPQDTQLDLILNIC